MIGTIVVNNEGVPIKSTLDNPTTVQYSGLLNNLVDQVHEENSLVQSCAVQYIPSTVKYTTAIFSFLNNLVDQVHKGYSLVHTVQYSLVQYSGILNNLVVQLHKGYNLIKYSTVQWST